MQTFTTQFNLSREYLGECFDESLPHSSKAKPNHWLHAFLLLMGAGLLVFTDQPKMIGALVVTLVVLELIHSRYKRAWWLSRQMWGRGAVKDVKLSLDEQCITTESDDNKTTLYWCDVDRVIETERGLILKTKAGASQYLSKSLFPADVTQSLLQLNSDDNA